MDPADARRSHELNRVHTVMLIDGGESHSVLHRALRPIDEWLMLVQNSGFEYDHVLYNVRVVLTGDMKFLAIVKGLQSVNATHACPLCVKPKHAKSPSSPGGFQCACDRGGVVDRRCTHWTGADDLRSQRQADECVALASKDSYVHKGYVMESAIRSIDFDKIILDVLHANFRITDVLFQTIIQWASGTCASSDELRDVLRSIEVEFTAASKQQFSVYGQEGIRDASALEWSTLWNKSRQLLLKNVDLSTLKLGSLAEPVHEAIREHLQGICEDMANGFEELSSPERVSLDRIDAIQSNYRNLVSRIRDIIGPKKVTPYMHCLEAHLNHMFRRTPFLSMGAFACQSLELKNHQQTLVLFRQTMKGGARPGSMSRSVMIMQEILTLELTLTFVCRNHQS